MKTPHLHTMLSGLALVFAGTLATAQDEEAPLQSDAEIAAGLRLPYVSITEFEKWRNFVRPTKDEASYQAVDWIPTFAGGLHASAEQNKPLLFWAMNGHPLGCT
jgi:hypothetical protein